MKKLSGFKNWPSSMKLRLVLGLVFFVIISLFLYLRVVPFGKATYSKSWPDDFNLGGSFVDDFRPADRLDLSSSDALKIIAEPLYFSLFSPRPFDKLKVKIVYENKLSSDTPIIELGLLKDKKTGAYDLQALQNKTIDKLRFSWQRLAENDDLIILQKEKIYNDSESFWKDFNNKNLKSCQPNSLSCVAFYNYPIAPNFNLPSYTELYPLRLENDLRGSHKLYVYFNDKPGSLAINFKAAKEFEAEENLSAEIRVYRDGKLLETKRVVVPGLLEFFSLSSGLYKIETVTSDKVLIDSINSSSDRLVFLNKVHLSDIEEGVSLFTSAKTLYASTLETEALGVIDFAEQEYHLNKTHSQVILRAEQAAGVQEIKNIHPGLMLSASGVFSFDGNKLFDPETRQIDAFFVPDNYQYLVANYQEPASKGDFKEVVTEFSLLNSDYIDGKYSFLISIPGLAQDKGYDSNAEILQSLNIKEISFEMEGKTLWQKIKEVYAN